MKYKLLATLSAFLAVPLISLTAHAAEANPATRAATILNDPEQQDRIADAISTMMGALMNVNIGPLADVIARADPYSDASDIPAEATLGDVVGRDSDDARAMGDQVRNSTRMAGAAATALGAYLPVLRDVARDMTAQVEENIRRGVK